MLGTRIGDRCAVRAHASWLLCQYLSELQFRLPGPPEAEQECFDEAVNRTPVRSRSLCRPALPGSAATAQSHPNLWTTEFLCLHNPPPPLSLDRSGPVRREGSGPCRDTTTGTP